MSWLKVAQNPYVRLSLNFAYAVGNCALGFSGHSWWFITIGAYYIILSASRFSVLQIQRKAKGNFDIEIFAKRITGILLIMLAFCIMGVVILSALKDRGRAYHEIVMITIATYTFTKITIAIIGMIKAKHAVSPVVKTLRNISLADACVSIYTMQRSMLLSFPGMASDEIELMNILTGAAVWIIVLLLGINLIGGKGTIMAKSKIINATEKIADAVTDGYKKIEHGVISGYKSIERGAVEGYTKMEDKFVEKYLAKDGEGVEEAKERLKNGKQ